MLDSDVRFALAVDNEPAVRLEEFPAFLQSNQQVMVRLNYNGGIAELVSVEETDRYPQRQRDVFWGCRWLQFYLVRFYAPPTDAPLRTALNWQVTVDDHTFTPDSEANYQTTYADRVALQTVWRAGPLRCVITLLAPQTTDASPRGALYVMTVRNDEAVPVTARVSLTGPGVIGEPCQPSEWHSDARRMLYRGTQVKMMRYHLSNPAERPAAAVIAPFGTDATGAVDGEPRIEWELMLAPGQERECAVAIGLGATLEAAHGHCDLLHSHAPGQWLAQTIEQVARPLGDLRIEGGEWWQAFFLNHYQQGNAALRADREGRIIAASIGPDFVQDTVQEADIFHGMSVHHWLNPELFRKFILFYCQYLYPPPSVPVIHNTQASVAPPILAEMYYRATGDKTFFRQHPEVGGLIEQLFVDLMKFKDPQRWLFPAEEVSDGHPLNKYDFPTNLRMWQAFRGAARIMGEVYDRPGLAAFYADAAERVRNDIFATMTGEGVFGPQFAAGTDLPETTFFFDGEENIGVKAPYLGFCDFTDVRWRNYCRQGLSEFNVTYEPVTSGQRWWDDPNMGHTWIPITSPCFAANIEAAVTRDEARRAMRQAKWLSDVDTSFYWWPFPHRVRSRLGLICHSLWMTSGVANTILTHYLGVNLDVPRRELDFRPWLPWRRFAWDHALLGATDFSYHHLRGQTAHTSTVTNHTADDYRGRFGFFIPPGRQCGAVVIDGLVCAEVTCQPFYEETFVSVPVRLPAGRTVKVSAQLIDEAKVCGGNG
jgi:hypothetical protein